MSIIRYNGHTWNGVDSITLKGDVTGTSVFNAETGKTEIDTFIKRGRIYRGNIANAQGSWYRIAQKSYPKNYQDFSITLLIKLTYANNTQMGILSAKIRTSPDGFAQHSIIWDYNTGIDPTISVLAIYYENNACIAEIWLKNNTQYLGITYTSITESDGSGGEHNMWTLESHFVKPGLSEIPSDYTQIPATLATIQNPVSALSWKLFGIYDISIDEFKSIDVTSIQSSVNEFLLFIGIPGTNTSQVYGGKSYIIPADTQQLNIVSDRYYYSGNYDPSNSTGMIRNSILYAIYQNNAIGIMVRQDGPLRARLYWR